MTDRPGMVSRGRDVWLIVGLFVAVRLLVLAAGQRFDADNLTTWMQIADVALLRDDLARTLWFLHSQPPLFNLIVGLAVKAGPAAFPWLMEIGYAAVTLGGILALHALVRDLTGRPRLAVAVAIGMCVAPSVLLYAQKLYYDGLVPWMLCIALWGLHGGLRRGSFARLLGGFAMLAAVVLLRSMIHPILFVAVTAAYAGLARGRHRRVMAAALLPAAAIGALMAKNLLLFGMAGFSSWAPLNLDHTTVDRLPPPLRARMIADGRLSPLSVIDGLSPPDAYLRLLPPIAPTGEPSLDAVRKSTGDYNWNHIVYTRLGDARTKDAIAALKADPASFAKVLATSAYHFHRPASEFKGLERNLAVIAPWDRAWNAVVGLQPVAWAGGSLDTARPRSALLQISYTKLLASLGFAAEGVMVALALLAALRTRRWPDPRLATEAAIVMIGGFVFVVSSSFDVWENNRASFDVAPIMLLGALLALLRLQRRRARARRRASIRTTP